MFFILLGNDSSKGAKNTRISLFCTQGVSTGILVNMMRQHMEPGDSIKAYRYYQINEKILESDVVLLGPQVRFFFKSAKALCDPLGVPCDIIDLMVYGRADGKAAYDQAKRLYQSSKDKNYDYKSE